MADQKISQIAIQLPLTTDLMVAARDNSGDQLNVTFTIADLLAAVIGSPFKIFNTDTSYSEVGDNCIIEDARLKNATGYPVYTTQLNCEFRTDDLTYDAVNGTLTILGFHLQDGEHISLYPTSALGNQAGANQEIIDQMNTLTETVNTLNQSLITANEKIILLDQIAAPFKLSSGDPNGGRLVWNKPAILIPAGWEPDEDFAGRMALGRTDADTALNEVGKTGGAKSKTLTVNEIPAHVHPNSVVTSAGGHSGGIRGDSTGHVSNINTGSAGGGQAFSILNPYRIVEFIRFIGV